ncbi:hypothetical protein EJD97_014900 [Solanum chilense]|uniref:Uncharacterized protein n=1 Tax=Solanum chilense TaxID=4083 RepID=A0A6N2AGL8_SOLCI|nr:hypothetical protein EJD97_014900 [Solanum chilense]
MAKIILLYVIALFMIFPLFWSHGNATTPRKLGVRHNAVTSLPNTNEVTFDESENQDSPILSSSALTNTITIPLVNPTIFANEAEADKHGARQTPIIVTSLPNTNEGTQTNVVLPREPWSGHGSLIID